MKRASTKPSSNAENKENLGKSYLEQKFIKSISYMTMIVLVCVSILTLAISINLNISSIKQALNATLKNGNDNVESWFFEKESVLNSIADEMSLYNSEEDVDDIIRSLTMHKNSKDYLVDVYIGTKSNNMYCGSGWVPDSSYNVLDREWYVGVNENSGVKYT